jgi:hypothetical protein
MAASEWGMCKDCQWWQIDPEARVANTTMGVCTEEALQPFRLRVSGHRGCTHDTPGQPTQAAGSSASPPTAEPHRRTSRSRRSERSSRFPRSPDTRHETETQP